MQAFVREGLVEQTYLIIRLMLCQSSDGSIDIHKSEHIELHSNKSHGYDQCPARRC